MLRRRLPALLAALLMHGTTPAAPLCLQVDAGGVSTVKVVTNAQNVEEGMKVVFAVSLL